LLFPPDFFYRPLLYSYPTRRSGALTRFTTSVFEVVAYRSGSALTAREVIVVPLWFFYRFLLYSYPANVEAGRWPASKQVCLGWLRAGMVRRCRWAR